MARSRSRSPATEATSERKSIEKDSSRPKKKKDSSGFKWKEKKSTTATEAEEPKRLERGYRDRSPKPAYSASKKDIVPGSVEDKFGVSIDSKFGAGASSKISSTTSKDAPPTDSSQPPKRKAAPTSAPRPTNEPMIIVNVNDRLGTKAAIPCLASDKIGMFKIMVAAQIGRKPHEIMLKRQGERPFKDMLTLEDYGVSNGVQLDLEVDSGE